MPDTILFRFIVMATLLSTLLTGCGSTAPVRYYTLEPAGIVMPDATYSSAQPLFALAIGPLEIPDFLERPHIVTRNGNNEMVIAEYDRWAGSLKQDVMRVLVEDLSTRLAPQVSVHFWKKNVPMNWRVAVEITRLDVSPGREVLLRAQWTLFCGDRKTPCKLRNQTFREVLTGKDLDAAVTVIGCAVGRLGEEIAADVKAQLAKDE